MKLYVLRVHITVLSLPLGLYNAAISQNADKIRQLLREHGVRDEPADDGLTAFAISLAFKNVDIVLDILKSDVQPKDDILFLAREVIKLKPRGDPEFSVLQTSVSETLESMGIGTQPFCTFFVQEMKHTKLEQRKFPLVNPNIEEQTRYFKNKAWQQTTLHHNLFFNDWMVKSSNLMLLALGKFCIKTKSDSADMSTKWALQEVEASNCSHVNDRYILYRFC